MATEDTWTASEAIRDELQRVVSFIDIVDRRPSFGRAVHVESLASSNIVACTTWSLLCAAAFIQAGMSLLRDDQDWQRLHIAVCTGPIVERRAIYHRWCVLGAIVLPTSDCHDRSPFDLFAVHPDHIPRTAARSWTRVRLQLPQLTCVVDIPARSLVASDAWLSLALTVDRLERQCIIVPPALESYPPPGPVVSVLNDCLPLLAEKQGVLEAAFDPAYQRLYEGKRDPTPLKRIGSVVACLARQILAMVYPSTRWSRKRKRSQE